MEGIEGKPARKPKSRAKQAVKDETKSLSSDTLSAPTEGQAEAGTVKAEKKESGLKISRTRKKKNAEPQPQVPKQTPGIALDTAQTVSAPSHLSVGEPPEVPVIPQKEEALPTATLASLHPDADRVANDAAKSEKKDKEGKYIRAIALVQQRLIKKGSFWIINLCAYGIISILLGFSQPVTHVPLLDFIESRKLTVLTVLCVVVFLTVVLLLLHRRLRPMDARLKALGTVTIASSLSCVLCLSLLGIALGRPAWCPTSLCPAPQVITEPITTTQGSHDTNLDVYFISFQSTTYVIPGNPQKPDYIPGNSNPRSIGAIQLNAGATSAPYTIAIGLHSLYTGRYSIIINKVILFVTNVNTVPDPLHVYPLVLLTAYSTTNPARFVYQGQQAHQTIPDTYSTNLFRPVELASGESDQIDAAVVSHIPVDMHFRIQVTYHIATQEQQTLFLPQTFEVVFSNASHWHKYQLSLTQQSFVPEP